MARAPELYTTLSTRRIEAIGLFLLLLKIDDDMTRRDSEAILARNTCDFYGGKYCSIVGSLHSICVMASTDF
jgi:hypothetical protein